MKSFLYINYSRSKETLAASAENEPKSSDYILLFNLAAIKENNVYYLDSLVRCVCVCVYYSKFPGSLVTDNGMHAY